MKRLTDETAKAVRNKEVQEEIASDSTIGVSCAPQEVAAYFKLEQARRERVVKSAGIKADWRLVLPRAAVRRACPVPLALIQH